MVVSTQRPARIAQRLAPLPRCATITRPWAKAGDGSVKLVLKMNSYDNPWKSQRRIPCWNISSGRPNLPQVTDSRPR